ncbi:MAG: S-layer homology domain-containing protein [Oscillospiraceae bacterium]|nr:S-layer homology domain-containing protein [Oscillospiraceae bacterium]
MKNFVRKILLAAGLALVLCAAVSAAEPVRYAVSSEEQLRQCLHEAMEQRAEHIIFSDAGGFDELTKYEDKALTMELITELAAAIGENDDSDASYNMLNIEDMQAGDMAGELYFYFDYWTSAEEEAELDRQVAEICRSLALEALTDEQKLQRIYEYVGTNFVYDDEHKIFSAYEGLRTGRMTCQGYTLLMYKLLGHENIGCRIITGMADGVRHGWNIVRLGHKWYNIDVTWDAAEKHGEAMTWKWFCKNDKDFPKHERADAYDTAKFRRAYPISAASYRPDAVQLMLSGRTFTSLLIQMGQRAELQVQAKGEVEIISTDPSVVRVEEGNVLVPVKRGSCSIIGRSSNVGELPSMWTVSVADFTDASAWAKDAVQAYYTANLLPIPLCGDLTAPLTREDAAMLMTPLAVKLCGAQIPAKPMEFEDVSGDVKEAIRYLWALDIFMGTGEYTFSPQAVLTRQQAAKLIGNLVQAAVAEDLTFSQEPNCSDAEKISPWARGYAAFVMRTGLMRGFEDGTFRPNEPVTREQMVCVLNRLRSLMIKT